MSACRPGLQQLAPALADVTADAMGPTRRAFDTLVKVPHVAGTTAAKVLSAMKPQVLVMWDDAIACHYGFAQNAVGYCRFTDPMAKVCRELCQSAGMRPSGAGSRELEGKLALPYGAVGMPLAKLLDEWNWVTITQAPAHRS